MCALAAVALLMAAGGCARPEAPAPAYRWVAGPPLPAFDPDGPPDALRGSLERRLTRGLVAEDSTGRVALDAARALDVSDDSLVYTFRFGPALRFTDGARCSSRHFAQALEAGLADRTHGTRPWLLAAVRGAERVRAGRPLPPLGIETPNDTTLVVRLAHPDPGLLRKLAVPGVSDAWADRAAESWATAVGLGPYRVLEAPDPQRLVLVAAYGLRPDTIRVRFGVSSRTARALMRTGRADLLWPLPVDLQEEAIAGGYRWMSRAADPPRRLLLIARADTPPAHRLAARAALAHGVNRSRLVQGLERLGGELSHWFDADTRFDVPRFDPAASASWRERGNLGRSFHVTMAYDVHGVGSLLARQMQLGWAENSIYVDLEASGGRRYQRQALQGRAQLLLAEAQAVIAGPEAELAGLVMPLRGPAVGSFRTGWRTREFDAWIAPRRPPPPFPGARVRRRLEEERIVLPIASLPWTWVEREDGPPVVFHPHYGPRLARPGEAR